MHYVVCYTTVSLDKTSVTREKFAVFADAVAKYTLMCAMSNNVVLADVVENKIIKQFSSTGLDMGIRKDNATICIS